MKFSHNILHTYCFILCIKKEKVEICENRVVDMVAGFLKYLRATIIAMVAYFLVKIEK